MGKKDICVRSCLWVFFNVGLCLSPFFVAMLVTENLSLNGLSQLTTKGELFLLGIGIGSVAIGEWISSPPEAGIGKVVLGLLFLLLVTAFYCYIETAKISSALLPALDQRPPVVAKGLKITHALSLFAGISICSFVCMCYCWAKPIQK